MSLVLAGIILGMIAPFYGTLVAENNTHVNTTQIILRPYEKIFKRSTSDTTMRIEFYHILVDKNAIPSTPTCSGYAIRWQLVETKLLYQSNGTVRKSIFVGMLGSPSHDLIVIDSGSEVMNYAEWKVYVQ